MRRALGLTTCLLSLALVACQPAAPSAPSGAAPANPSAAQPQPAAPPPRKHLNVAYVAPSETMSIPWIAKEAGFFTKYGFDVDLQLVAGTPRLVQSLIAGDFDYAQVGASAVMRARVEHGDTFMLASSGNVFTFKLMAHPQAGVRSLADLRGKTVGISQIGSTSHTFLRVLLGRERVPLDDVNVLQTGSNPQAAAAMLTGNIDAAAVSGIMVPTAERAGAITLADGRALKVPAVSGALAATRRQIDRDRAEVQRFMRAYVEGIHHFKTRRDETIAIMQQYMSGLAWDETAYLWEEAAGDFQPVPYPSDEAVQAAIERDLELPAGEFKPADFYDVSFLREIEASGFVKELYQ